jgi:hypothetical protein
MVPGSLLPGKGGDLASAGTITPTHTVHNVTGVAAIATIAVPAGAIAGQILVLIPLGLCSFTAAANVKIAIVGVVNKALILVWDGTDWVPTYLV